jgi:hypothetical protein
MNKIIIYLVLFFLIAVPVYANPFMQLMSAGVAAESGGTNPDVYYQCEDNAASTTVTATYGNNGSLIGTNTADNTSTTAYAGSRSFSPAASATRLVSGALTEASIDDGAFTIQFAYYADNTTGFGTGNYVRLAWSVEDGLQFMFMSNNGSSTAFSFYLSGTEYNVTLDDINTGSWHLIRIVVNTGETNKAVVYQGTNESNLTAKYTRTAATSAPNFSTSSTMAFGGTGTSNQGIQLRNGKMDEIKIWYTAEIP